MKSIQKLVLFAGLGLSLVACSPSAENTNAEDLAVVKNYVKAVESLDYDAMNNFLADNYLGLGPSYGDSTNKTQAVNSWKFNASNLYKKIEHTKAQYAYVSIPEGGGKGNWIASWSELKITFQNEQTVMIWANSNYQVSDGKIVKSLTFYNEADALRQLGYDFFPVE
ncbi:hypothetical protein D0X99_00595 [Algoriphagus lacus]|uniref:Nuclear transport factor 2 family protein n=1 Tax=Algoriphagus lacus TaxID=2056311 RepID=A0A418PVW5_9BACT|nr:hypothetical protein [Algoriphagus lacus]RIW18233.1 hypothetical protein D0X99_00595 [Algoriphagus lacus]